jgi:choline dehydrogenase
MAGHKTLLIEAGDDQGANQNYTVPSFNAKVSEDPNLAWNFFVKHYADEDRQAKYFKAPSRREPCTRALAPLVAAQLTTL